MIINKRNLSKSNNNLKKIYGILNSLNRLKKIERLNSAINASYKIKSPQSKKIRIKKLNVIKNNEKLNNIYYALDIIKIKTIERKETNKISDYKRAIDSSSFNIDYSNKENKIVQTDKGYHMKTNKNLFSKKEYQLLNNPCKTILEYRIKRNKQKQRNIKELKEENKSFSSPFKSSKDGIIFPNIYNKDREFHDYLNASTNNKAKHNTNIKNYNYNSVLNNLRIKFRGNIHITRKSKGVLSIISYKRDAGIKNFKELIRNSSNLNEDKSNENTNLSKFEQNFSFSNKLIRDTLSEKNMKNIYKI